MKIGFKKIGKYLVLVFSFFQKKKNFPSIVVFVLLLRFAKKKNYIIDHKGSHSLNAEL
jgi:hypothetical protein